jgi:phospholipase C
MYRFFSRSVALASVAVLAACGGPGSSPSQSAPLTVAPPLTPARAGSSKIKHIVIIIQENRSTDNLFQFLPGANTQSYCIDKNGNQVALTSEALTGSVSPHHTHSDFVVDYAGGANNGWARAYCAYVPRSEVRPYYRMAEQYAFADEMFQTNQGPSFPAHQYLVSGASTITDGSALSAAENPRTPNGNGTGGCNSPPGSLVELINTRTGQENESGYPCFIRKSIQGEAQAAGLSWLMYQATTGAGYWKSLDAVENIWCLPGPPPCSRLGKTYKANVRVPSTQFLSDVGSCGKLAAITEITPDGAESDHAGLTNGSGPAYVASLVDAIGNSCFWRSTVIFVVWDDWGGWFDHVVPTLYNYYELGYRVPFIAISPYAKASYVSHVPHEFGSILKFTEEAFGLPSLGTTDVRSDDLSDMFDFSQPPRAFRQIPGARPASFFARFPETPPDDD